MVYHHWGDDTFDWAKLDEAIDFVSNYCRRWGRFGGQAKEKFGVCRFYAQIGWTGLHTLVYPGYYRCQFPQWLWWADLFVIAPFMRATLIDRLFTKWQIFIYSVAYNKAVKKYPSLTREILQDADHPKAIKNYKRMMKRGY